MRIALGQINPVIGDIAGNAAKIVEWIEHAALEHVELIIFPELAVVGYPPKDLLLKPDVIDQCENALRQIAACCTTTAAVIGYPCRSDKTSGRPLYNAAALCLAGSVVHRHVKHLLPTYDVFDETRYFEPGPPVDLAELHGRKLGISVCEDLWNDETVFARQLYHENPIVQLAVRGAQLFINCSASPFVVGKHAFRQELLSRTARRHHLPVVYVNQVGGNDELIFDGNSCVFDETGKLIAHAKEFAEDLLIVDLPASANEKRSRDAVVGRIEKPSESIASVWHALVMGLGDYCRKCGFKSVVLGLSGGIDSAVTACVAVAALGAKQVIGIAMPSRYSSEHSVADAKSLAKNLGITLHIVNISEAHGAMEHTMAETFKGTEPGIAEENIQARLRAGVLMAYSNKFGAMLVTTGNKSELAVGYCTLYGDMCGGLAVISDVPKTLVYELATYINDHAMPGSIPPSSITKPPSAELRPDQTDQDTLPPYEQLDEIIERYVERLDPAKKIIEETGIDAATVMRIVKLIDRNEYKRQQSAPGLKITGRAFGFGRRMPIAQRYDPDPRP